VNNTLKKEDKGKLLQLMIPKNMYIDKRNIIEKAMLKALPANIQLIRIREMLKMLAPSENKAADVAMLEVTPVRAHLARVQKTMQRALGRCILDLPKTTTAVIDIPGTTRRCINHVSPEMLVLPFGMTTTTLNILPISQVVTSLAVQVPPRLRLEKRVLNQRTRIKRMFVWLEKLHDPAVVTSLQPKQDHRLLTRQWERMMMTSEG